MWIVVAIAWAAFLAYLWREALVLRRYLGDNTDYDASYRDDWNRNTIEIEIVGFGDVPVATNHRAHAFLFRAPGGPILAMPEGKELIAQFGQHDGATLRLRGRSRHGLYSSRGWGTPPRLDTRAHLVLHPLGWTPYRKPVVLTPLWRPRRIVLSHLAGVLSVVLVAVMPAMLIPSLVALYACLSASPEITIRWVGVFRTGSR